jgi:membrane-associated phospholipid phosphatase
VAVGGALIATGPAPRRRDAGAAGLALAEWLAGAILVAVSIVAAVAVSIHPGPNGLDRWGFRVVPNAHGSAVLVRITDLGSPVVLIAGALLAAVVVRHDRLRAVSCVTAPLLAALLVEYSVKPLVGRHFEGVLSYPSGSTADVAALATAWAIAVPRRIRPPVIAAGVLVTGAMAVAVTGLRWHFPSDALAGAVLGVGTVLLIDGVLHLWKARPPSPASAAGSPSSPSSAESPSSTESPSSVPSPTSHSFTVSPSRGLGTRWSSDRRELAHVESHHL